RRRGAEGAVRYGLAPRHGSRRAHALDYEVERAGPRDTPHRRVHRRRLPRRASEHPRAGLPRDAARPPHEHAPGHRSAADPPPPRPTGDPRTIARAKELLGHAKRPVFLVGSQLRWSPLRDKVAAMLEAFGAPIYLNGMARGTLPYAHPLLFSRSRRFALSQADV